MQQGGKPNNLVPVSPFGTKSPAALASCKTRRNSLCSPQMASLGFCFLISTNPKQGALRTPLLPHCKKSPIDDSTIHLRPEQQHHKMQHPKMFRASNIPSKLQHRAHLKRCHRTQPSASGYHQLRVHVPQLPAPLAADLRRLFLKEKQRRADQKIFAGGLQTKDESKNRVLFLTCG